MNELGLVALVPVRLLIVAGFATLYALGGRTKKVLFRRVLGSLWLGGTVIALALVLGSFKWWLLAAPAAYFGALSLGYGADAFWAKVARRALYGLILGACALIFASATGSWVLGGFQVGLAVMASVVLGVFNPLNAVGEEALIAALSVALVPFLV